MWSSSFLCWVHTKHWPDCNWQVLQRSRVITVVVSLQKFNNHSCVHGASANIDQAITTHFIIFICSLSSMYMVRQFLCCKNVYWDQICHHKLMLDNYSNHCRQCCLAFLCKSQPVCSHVPVWKVISNCLLSLAGSGKWLLVLWPQFNHKYFPRWS